MNNDELIQLLNKFLSNKDKTTFYDCLTEFFSYRDIDTFCIKYFPKVREEEFTKFLDKNQKRRLLNDYCKRENSEVKLIGLLKKAIDDEDLFEKSAGYTPNISLVNHGFDEPVSHFMGREDKLLEISKKLDDNKICLITGFRGIGKSELTLQYASLPDHTFKNSLEEKTYKYKFFLSAKEYINTSANGNNLADLTKTIFEKNQENINSKIIQEIKYADGHVLIVFDDITPEYRFKFFNSYFYKELIGLGYKDRKVHILLTTNDEELEKGQDELKNSTIHLNPLSKEEAIKLLLNLAEMQNLPEDKLKIALEICNELGNVPLAIEQAGSYLLENRDLFQYLSKLKKSDKEKMEEIEANKGYSHHEEKIFESIGINYKSIVQNKNSEFLLFIISFLDIRIDKSILSEIFQKFEFEDFDSVLKTLYKYSFAKKEIEKDSFTLKFHSLIQFYIRTQIQPDKFNFWKKMINAILRIIGVKHHSKETFLNELWNFLFAILPSEINYNTIDRWEKMKNSLMLINGTSKLNELSKTNAIFSNYAEYYKIELKNPNDNLLSELNTFYGNYKQSIAYKLKAILKLKDPILLTEAYLEIANLYLKDGDFKNAEKYFITAKNSYKNLKDDKKYLDKLLECIKKIGILYFINIDHSQITTEQQAKDFQFQLEEIFKEGENLLFEHKPDKPIQIRDYWHEIGQELPALPFKIYYLEKSIQFWIKYDTKKDSFIPDVLLGIGVLFYYSANNQMAIHYYNDALNVYVQKENPIGEASSYNNIGLVYSNTGDNDKALEYLHKALAIQLKTIGGDHPDTASSYNNIGFVYRNKGDHDKALEYYHKALAIRLKTIGGDHPDTATSYNNIGTVYSDKGDYDKALEYHEKALGIYLKTIGGEHPDTAMSYNNIGTVYSDKGDYNKALEYHEKALGIYLKIIGGEHPDTASSFGNIGNVYGNKGDSNKALEYYHRALFIYVLHELYQKDHYKNIVNNIYSTHKKLGHSDLDAQSLVQRDIEEIQRQVAKRKSV